jgi:hypothetical protein
MLKKTQGFYMTANENMMPNIFQKYQKSKKIEKKKKKQIPFYQYKV